VNAIGRLFGIVAAFLLVAVFGFYIAAIVGDYTGWYRLENYISMSDH